MIRVKMHTEKMKIVVELVRNQDICIVKKKKKFVFYWIFERWKATQVCIYVKKASYWIQVEFASTAVELYLLSGTQKRFPIDFFLLNFKRKRISNIKLHKQYSLSTMRRGRNYIFQSIYSSIFKSNFFFFFVKRDLKKIKKNLLLYIHTFF